MSIQTFYRLAVWLPLAVPALVAWLVHGVGIDFRSGPARVLIQMLLGSLLYGGLPYMLLALWATWWIGGRPEAEIRWLVVRAPLLMAASFVPFVVLLGLLFGGPLAMFLGVGLLGAAVSVLIGYGYVGVVLLLREAVGPAPTLHA